MKVSHRRIISTIASGSFMVAAITGLIYSLPPTIILIRSLAAAFSAGFVTVIAVIIFERIWTK